MKFGSFVFSISTDPNSDHRMISQTLGEIELAEKIGFDAIWLTEHHFDGAVAYADPVVFGAAVAARTKRVLIGFAVVEMALHHPVRLAVQTSLLDNLSNGRLIMGTGRGSAYNEYEYIGFGTTLENGREMLDEAEELLIKAWTGTDVVHKGKFWDLSFPGLRPRPGQADGLLQHVFDQVVHRAALSLPIETDTVYNGLNLVHLIRGAPGTSPGENHHHHPIL